MVTNENQRKETKKPPESKTEVPSSDGLPIPSWVVPQVAKRSTPPRGVSAGSYLKQQAVPESSLQRFAFGGGNPVAQPAQVHSEELTQAETATRENRNSWADKKPTSNFPEGPSLAQVCFPERSLTCRPLDRCRVFPKIRSTAQIYHESWWHQVGVIL